MSDKPKEPVEVVNRLISLMERDFMVMGADSFFNKLIDEINNAIYLSKARNETSLLLIETEDLKSLLTNPIYKDSMKSKGYQWDVVRMGNKMFYRIWWV